MFSFLEGTRVMRRFRAACTTATVTAPATMAAGCGGGTGTAGGGAGRPGELVYRASNQGPSAEADKRILTPG
ncbi:hypothetical protein Sdia_30590 [Streptomyces diastaticus subsp. diastaticus]|nr:hypothetical protein Sdia_30590 [Streptomyces diastaticus subsp. diastaticus]GGU27078.1 hypothetical protein GCM10015534_32200 [Streptomyces diastaticus subsp. diastaticus]